MKDLKGYAYYLRKNHINDLAVDNLDLALEMEIPLLQLYIHLPRQQLIEGSVQSYDKFLTSLIDGTSIEIAKQNILLWEEDKIPGFSQDSLGPSDLILIYALQKKVLIKYLPKYTRDIIEVVNIVHELDAHYMEVQNLAITALFRIKKKTSDRLSESEERFRLLVENVKDCSIFMIDPNGDILSWNAGAENISGFTSEEIIGKNISVFYIEKEVEAGEPQRNLKFAKEKGKYENDGWRVRKDKTRFWANIIYTALYDKSGNIKSYVKVTRDISERKSKDEKIAKTLKQLSEAQQMAHLGSWEWDIEKKQIFWSEELYRIYGLEVKQEIIKIGEYAKYNYPDDAKMITDTMDEALKKKQPFDFNYRIITDHKIIKTLHARGIVITDASSNAVKMSGTLQDITERKRTEEKIEKTIRQLSQAQQLAQIGSWEWDMITNTISWSDELYRIWGFGPQEFPPRFRGYLYFIHPDDRKKAQLIIAKAIKAKNNFQLEHRILTKQGEVRIINSQGKIVLDEEGKRIVMSGTSQDITERVQTKTNLRKAEDMVKAKQQFLSNMSHEIRTPMNAIIGFTKLALKTELNTQQREYIESIKISGDTMMVLINDILDLAKVDEGKIVFEEVPFMLSASISVMLQLFEPKLKEKNIELRRIYDLAIPKVLIGDSVRLHQIILNLMSNALKFTRKGQIIVEVKLINEDEEKAIVAFSFTDDGIGIPSDKLDSIFENFQQAHDNTSRVYGGTGLGLAIVKQLVERQGGCITVESEVDKGSVSTFQLPFKKAAQNVETKLIEDVIKENEMEVNIKNIKVLVVEDILLNQLLIKTVLSDFGCMYDVAENGKIAIQKLHENEFDVVLMDLHMPVMNGFEATEYIRKTLHLDIPIIGLTADVTTADLKRCLGAGMNDYLSKPIDEYLLQNKIRSVLSVTEISKNKLLPEETEKYVNFGYMKNRTKNNKELMRELITIYLKQTPDLILNLNLGIQNNDYNKIYNIVHALLPSFKIFGIHPDFETMTRKIQKYAEEKNSLSSIKVLAAKIELVCMKVCDELNDKLEIMERETSVITITNDNI